jgi:putative ABC transport system permease protein
VFRESQYFATQANHLSRFITAVGGLIALLMGIGAVVGAINILYTAISARSREIATLRAVGFGRPAVVGSVLVEGLLLGLIGGAIGVGVAYALFNGFQASTLSGYSAVVFRFAVTPALIAIGLAFALAMGFIGGLFPAIRAARLPIPTALRDT